MEPWKSMNTFSGPINFDEIKRRGEAAAKLREEHRLGSARPVGDRYDGGPQAGSLYASGVIQQLRAPGKMFARSDILAIIRAERTKWMDDGTEMGGVRYRAAMETFDDMARIFENLE